MVARLPAPEVARIVLLMVRLQEVLDLLGAVQVLKEFAQREAVADRG